ncbi:hypothetical protein VNI00_002920 [Paramarasmius palmivorus]|uniref:Uncharacterized protein n=1 Tax=Paramarasmius palmivorus TaxID=297713 RepID=A0AAW0DZL8_9AGAR
MAIGIETDVAELAGIIAEAGLYGVLTVLTAATLYILIQKNPSPKLNLPLILTSCLMYTLATAQMVVDCVVIFDAFIDLPRPERIALMANLSIPIVATKRALFFVMLILGDAIVIYRCWVVWDHNWLLITFPVCCSLVSGVIAFISIWATQNPEAGSFILKAPWTYGTVIFVMSLCANATSTALIAYRIWSNDRKFTSGLPSVGETSVISGRGRLLPIAKILIESGALNTAFLVTYTAVLQAQKRQGGLAVVADMSTPFIGIVFSLVIVRIGLRSRRIGLPSTIATRSGQDVMPINLRNEHEMATFRIKSNGSEETATRTGRYGV